MYQPCTKQLERRSVARLPFKFILYPQITPFQTGAWALLAAVGSEQARGAQGPGTHGPGGGPEPHKARAAEQAQGPRAAAERATCMHTPSRRSAAVPARPFCRHPFYQRHSLAQLQPLPRCTCLSALLAMAKWWHTRNVLPVSMVFWVLTLHLTATWLLCNGNGR